MNAKRTFWIVALAYAAITTWALPTEIKNKAFYQGINYSWPYNAVPADQTTSNLSEIATDPDQIIAMLRTVYMNKTIPGNYVRGYDANGQNEGTWVNGVATGSYPVAYPAIGTLGMSNNTFEFFRFDDAYGWNIPGTIKTSEGKGSVTFRANNQADRARFNSIKKSGITVKATNLCYTYGSSSSYEAYYSVNKNDTLVITAVPGKKITKVTLSFRSSDYNGGAATNFYSGRATKVFRVMTKQCYIKQIDVEYEAETVTEVSTSATFPDFYSGSETVSFTPGRNYGVGFNSSYSGSRANQGAFGIGYMSSMGTSTSTYYTANNNSTQWFFTQEGYIMTNFKLNFESATYGTSNIKSISYLALDGSTYTTITATTTPSLSEFLTDATTLEFTLPTNYVSITPKSSTEMHITGVEATYVYNNFDDIYLAYDTYVPNEEGNTVLLMEVKDFVDVNALVAAGLATTKTVNNKTEFDRYNVNDYESLRALVAATIKSARVLTDAKRVGESTTNPGTLFKIDCDKLNRFFLLGKGQLRWFNNDYNVNDVNASTQPRNHTQNTEGQPYFFAGTYTSSNINQSYTYDRSTYYDQSLEALFGHMFEQFSPALASGGTSLNDIYRLLVNGDSFDVKHDCIDVISAESKGHEFNMYGKTSASDDCQDVRDMMFFVPDYRMLTFNNGSTEGQKRDPNKAQKFLYYNTTHAPTMGLYVIKLDPITQVNKVEGEVAYDVTLDWNSNLLQFLPGEQGKYTLYRVTVGTDGTETYEAIHEITTNDANHLTYVDRVPQQPGSQVITYAVRGQDQDGFLSLQMSNKESALIPGTDTSEQLQLQLGADYYSRFDPQEVKNNYSNLIKLGNSQVTKIQSSYLTTDGTKQFTFTRKYVEGGEMVTKTFATAHVATLGTNSGTLAVTMQEQEFFKFGYQSNNNSATQPNPNGSTFTLPFTFDATGVNFGQVQFYDNFSASVANNDHPGEYVYQVRFDYLDPDNENAPSYALSNEMRVYVQKTDMNMASVFTLEQVEADGDRNLPADGVNFDIQVKYSSKKDILRYDAYRWNEGDTRYIIEPTSPVDDEQDVAPNGIAGNQGDFYTVAMNAGNYLYTGSVDVPIGGAANARFVDYYADANPGEWTYAPVIERFAPREDRADYNTYGAPLRPAVSANVKLSVPADDDHGNSNPIMSEYTWTSGGKQYAYYNVLLDIIGRGANNDEVLVPNNYELYKVRVWRLIDTQYLGEELAGRQGRVKGDYLMEELTYPAIQAGAEHTLLGMSPTPFAHPHTNEVAATFGAIDVKHHQTVIPVKFIVRAYYTLASNLSSAGLRAGAKAGEDAEFYVVEREVNMELNGTDDSIITAISGIVTDRQVAGVTYYNLLGVPSARPVPGINIQVTRYTDGTTTTNKVIF